jgi:hypothetical protein
MTTFTTNVTAMYTLPQVDGQTDVVVNAAYIITGVNGEHTVSVQFNQHHKIQQGELFTPYSELTENQVIEWVSDENIANWKSCVEEKIQTLLNPPINPTSQELPWLDSQQEKNPA